MGRLINALNSRRKKVLARRKLNLSNLIKSTCSKNRPKKRRKPMKSASLSKKRRMSVPLFHSFLSNRSSMSQNLKCNSVTSTEKGKLLLQTSSQWFIQASTLPDSQSNFSAAQSLHLRLHLRLHKLLKVDLHPS